MCINSELLLNIHLCKVLLHYIGLQIFIKLASPIFTIFIIFYFKEYR